MIDSTTNSWGQLTVPNFLLPSPNHSCPASIQSNSLVPREHPVQFTLVNPEKLKMEVWTTSVLTLLGELNGEISNLGVRAAYEPRRQCCNACIQHFQNIFDNHEAALSNAREALSELELTGLSRQLAVLNSLVASLQRLRRTFSAKFEQNVPRKYKDLSILHTELQTYVSDLLLVGTTRLIALNMPEKNPSMAEDFAKLFLE